MITKLVFWFVWWRAMVRWFFAMMHLAIHAHLVWGVSLGNMDETMEEIRGTPLRYDLQRLEQALEQLDIAREKFTGKP